MTIVNDKVTTALKTVESGKGRWFPGMGDPITMEKFRTKAGKLADVYTGVAHTKKALKTVAGLPTFKTTGNETVDKLATAFGTELASRIVACSMIQAEAMEDKEGFEEEGAVLRFTIGMIKRMRRQAIESGQNMTWESAVDRLEIEQEEGRHYTYQGSLGRTFASQVKAEEHRIKAREKGYIKEAEVKGVSVWSLKVEVEAERLQEEANTKAVDASDVVLTLQGIFASWTPKRLSWFRKVLDGLRNGAELTKAQRKTIHDYAPAGVTASEFVELAVRYA